MDRRSIKEVLYKPLLHGQEKFKEVLYKPLLHGQEKYSGSQTDNAPAVPRKGKSPGQSCAGWDGCEDTGQTAPFPAEAAAGW